MEKEKAILLYEHENELYLKNGYTSELSPRTQNLTPNYWPLKVYFWE